MHTHTHTRIPAEVPMRPHSYRRLFVQTLMLHPLAIREWMSFPSGPLELSITARRSLSTLLDSTFSKGPASTFIFRTHLPSSIFCHYGGRWATLSHQDGMMCRNGSGRVVWYFRVLRFALIKISFMFPKTSVSPSSFFIIGQCGMLGSTVIEPSLSSEFLWARQPIFA